MECGLEKRPLTSYTTDQVTGRAPTVDWEIDGARQLEQGASVMEAIAETLEQRLREWKPETSQKVRALVAEIIELADDDALDIGRSRGVEQEVLDILDESSSR